MKTWYVTLFRRWNSKSKVWMTAVGVSDERPQVPHETDLAIYEVTGCTKGAAVAVVMEWLERYRTNTMTVRQVWKTGEGWI